MTRRRVVAVLFLVVAALLAGCRGVPTSSGPQKVDELGLGGEQIPPLVPQKGEGARDIVNHFLTANSLGPQARSSSLRFLTEQEQNSWSDSTVQVVADEVVGTFTGTRLTVTGRPIGSLDKNGIYTPSYGGVGNGGDRQKYVFGIAKVHGEYRISSVPHGLGLLLTDIEFDSAYQPYNVYFFDSADQQLVPDLRYSSLQGGALADWLLGALQSGPRPALNIAVSTDTLPSRLPDLQVKLGAVTEVQVDGARQLAGPTRDRLAAQIASTLHDTVPGEIAIVDNGARVPIPHVNGTQFSADDFPAFKGPGASPPILYYLNAAGRIHCDGGPQLRGEVAQVAFNAVALARPPQIGKLTVAGVQGRNLYIATVDRHWLPPPVALASSQLSRPVWAPRRNEVWIAAGANLYRVVTNGRSNKVVHVGLTANAPTSRIAALRISPDGTRIALVLASGQLEVGAIVRNGAVTIAGLTPISPAGVHLTDVAWADTWKLYATGYLARTGDGGVFETNDDGADWIDFGLTTLPNRANTITAASNANAWVDSNGYVWEQDGTAWVSPTSQDQTAGTKPMYLG